MTCSITHKALVLSPIASHPQDYGNRNRVFQMTRLLKDNGYEVHFLLYPIEPDWSRGIPRAAEEMRKEWDTFTIIPPSRPLHQAAAETHHTVDEWWDPVIGHYLEWLLKRQFFELMLVNYTFFSRALELAPRGTAKVLEMHDLFSGRKELFSAHGVGADFFYTVPEQERIAFERADIVIAIKDAEAKFVRSLTSKPVAVSVPFYMPERVITPRAERLMPEQDLRVGFLGADNLVNLVNMRRFLEYYVRAQEIYVPNLTLHIAGNVCTNLQMDFPNVSLLGRVDSIEEFYRNIDVVIAPLMFSTGIKIKVGEALSFGKPIVATENGFDGYEPTHEFHSLKSYEEVSHALIQLAFDRERLKVLEERSALAARFARRANADGCRALTQQLRARSKSVVLITDRPIWTAGSLLDERLAQWIQLFSNLCRAVVIYVGTKPITSKTRDDLSQVTFLDLSSDPVVDRVCLKVEEFARAHEIADLAISVSDGLADQLWQRMQSKCAYITLDLWERSLAKIANAETGNCGGDVWATQRDDDGVRTGRRLSVLPLRYEPHGLREWARGVRSTETWIARCDPRASEEAGIQMILHVAGDRRIVRTVDLDLEDSRGVAHSFASMQDRSIPSFILAVGSNHQTVEMWRSLAQQLDVPCLHLSDEVFPVLLQDRSGEQVLCFGYTEMAKLIPTLHASVPSHTIHTGDTGWRSYWNLLAGR